MRRISGPRQAGAWGVAAATLGLWAACDQAGGGSGMAPRPRLPSSEPSPAATGSTSGTAAPSPGAVTPMGLPAAMTPTAAATPSGQDPSAPAPSEPDDPNKGGKA